jgi:hypothetical protein
MHVSPLVCTGVRLSVVMSGPRPGLGSCMLLLELVPGSSEILAFRFTEVGVGVFFCTCGRREPIAPPCFGTASADHHTRECGKGRERREAGSVVLSHMGSGAPKAPQ